MPEIRSFQPIDLDYIVSVSPVQSISHGQGFSMNSHRTYFYIYIKLGQPIFIGMDSEDYHADHPEMVENLNKEREKLIKAWTEGQI
jgi:hypothetical protein